MTHIDAVQTASLPDVLFVGAGPGSCDHLTMGAYRALQDAQVVIYDRLVSQEILDVIAQDAQCIDVGKEGFGPSTSQAMINLILVTHALSGKRVVRLKGGDPGIFGRLDEEIDALSAQGLNFRILPGLTAASVAAAQIGQSLTKRGRNAALRILTGHDMEGFAEQDWRGLARSGEVAAIYMGKKSARFIQGRLLMHGADPATQISLVENVSRADQRVVSCSLQNLPQAVSTLSGPAVILYGIAPRAACASNSADHSALPAILTLFSSEAQA